MKTINIVAGGPRELIPDLSEYTDGDTTWVGVDKGTVALWRPESFRRKLSVILTALRKRSSCRFKSGAGPPCVSGGKDYTDLELALDWALQKNRKTFGYSV